MGKALNLVQEPARDVPASDSPATARVPVPRSRYGAALIVDDEPMIRKLAVCLLPKHGLPVLEAGNGREAIDRLARDGAEVRAVLLDMAMPEMSGDVALPIIRQLRPDIRVIVSSGFHDRDVEQRFRHIAARSFLPKPYTRGKLLAELVPAVSLS